MFFSQAPTLNAQLSKKTHHIARVAPVCSAESSRPHEVSVTRRQALGLAGCAGLAASLGVAQQAQAAYGEGARVFGSKITNATGFIPYSGEGYALLLPSKWNPSKEKDFPGVQLRYEDNGDNVNSVYIIRRPTSASSIDQVGTPEKFLTEVQGLLGQQVFSGQTRSEGGFQPNKVSAASLLDVERVTDKKGTTYYKYKLLTRSADGNEGGKHQLITAAVSNGNLYICKVQIGDKRWFKGANKDGEGIHNSFVVA